GKKNQRKSRPGFDAIEAERLGGTKWSDAACSRRADALSFARAVWAGSKHSMAKKSIIGTAQDTLAGAAASGAETALSLAGSVAGTMAKAATGTALTAVRGAR